MALTAGIRRLLERLTRVRKRPAAPAAKPDVTPSDGAGLLSPLRRRVGAALDSSVLRLMKSPSRYPKLVDYIRLQGEVNQAYYLYKSQGVLDDPAAFHRPPPQLRAPSIKSVWYPGLPYEQISFESGYEPDAQDKTRQRWVSYQSNRTAYAWALRQADPSRPWLVCLHGLGTGNPWMDFPGFRANLLYRELGFNLLFPVLPLHGPRKPADMERGSLLSFELLNTVHGLAQTVWEARRLIDWIRAQGGTTVGLYGMSMGAYAAALISALADTDLVICGIPLCDVPELFASHTTPTIRDRAEQYGVLGDRVRELYRVVSPITLRPRPPRASRFIIAGLADRITPPIQAQRLWEAWEQPEIKWFDGGHISYFWSRQIDPFLDRALLQLQAAPLERAA